MEPKPTEEHYLAIIRGYVARLSEATHRCVELEARLDALTRTEKEGDDE